MSIFQSVLLAILQGITEFLPISSSAHLVLLPRLLGWQEQSTAFDIILHGGTLLAITVYFRKDIIDTFKNFSKNKKLIINIAIVTFPAAIFGLFFSDFIDLYFKKNWIIVLMLILLGLVFLVIDKIGKKNKSMNDLTLQDAFFIGFCQSTAFLRGTSRSGVTMIGGLISGLKRKQAARFAFLAGIPIMSAAFLKQIVNFSTVGLGNTEFSHLLVGFIFSFLSGVFTVKFLMKFITKHGLKWFGIYRIVLAIIVLLVLF